MSIANRRINVVTVSQQGLRQEGIFDATIDRLNMATIDKLDIACLPENCNGGVVEGLDGPTILSCKAWACEHACYVICPLHLMDAGVTYNAAVVIDRTGSVMGYYSKINPTESELDDGISPGTSDVPVFKTDFGIIGIQICFDVNWHQSWKTLKEKGADIIFWSSAYPASRQLMAHAWINEVFVVSSTITLSSAIYDISGNVLSQSSKYAPYARATLCLDKRLFEIDYQVKKVRAAEQKYGSRICVEWMSEEDWFTVESLDPLLSVQSIIDEFALLPKTEYHKRCSKRNSEKRKS